MDGRAFLDVARRLAQQRTEADWRTASGRAYYSLLLEGKAALERWGFLSPPRDRVHRYVRLCFTYASERDLKTVGRTLEALLILRNEADYEPKTPGKFASAAAAQQAVRDAASALSLLDQIDGDAGRRAAAIASIRPPP
jgi:hypothetical protein